MFNVHRDFARVQRLSVILAFVACLGGPNLVAASQSPAVKKEHVVARALADREALNPGETAQLAVNLKMDPAWHVYWRNSGDGPGLPTGIEWSGPPGFKFGRTQFPAPHVHHDKTVGDSFIHEGTAYFLTEVIVPENAPVGKTVELKVKVDWLVCKEACIIGDAELTLKMLIAAKATAAKPANVEEFKKARADLPLPVGKAPYVKITAGMEKSPVKPGAKVNADLNVAIEKAHHLQSHKPKGAGMIATLVFVEPPEGFELGKIEYPAGKDRTVAGMTLNEYDGTIRIRMPFTVDPEASKSPRFIRGILRYQACNDKGTCYPAEHASFVIPVQMEGGEAPGRPDEPVAIKAQRAEAGPETIPAAGASSGAGAADSAAPSTFQGRVEKWFAGFGNVGIVLLALVGGMLLNLMPCVLPVISLKVLSFVRHAHQDRWRIFQLGMAYSVGILTFFGFLTFMFLVFQKGWGELFQSPSVVIVISGVVFALALSLFGVFTIFTPSVVSELATKAEGESVWSAFGTGVLATLLGTACSGPGIGAALGAASKMTPVWGGLVFMAVGVGMALPFVLLAAQPAWVRFVPKPGKWMKTFEEVMGFLLLGTVVSLLNPLRNQIGGWGMMMTLLFFIGVAVACTIKGRIGWGDATPRKLRLYAAATGVLALSWLVAFGGVFAPLMPSIHKMVEDQREIALLREDGETYRHVKKELERLSASGGLKGGDLDSLLGDVTYDLKWDKGIPWQHFNSDKVRKAVERGYTVFVDYTADWCWSCKTNKNTSIDVEDTRLVMKDLGVVPFEADYTNRDPRIKLDLDKYNRPGVPMYLVYRPHKPDEPEVLPEVLTPSVVIEGLRRAGPSKLAARPASNDITLATPSSSTPARASR